MAPITITQFMRTVAVLATVCVAFPACGNEFVTGHQFAVSEAGTATITIPIQVPRGIGGMEPQLSLNYSSGSGNGLLGLGWVLAGPSAITRCPKSVALNEGRGAVTFGVGDRYCLDGQRLVMTGQTSTDTNYGNHGTVYRTERDTFARITAIGQYGTQQNTPTSFRVETKAGLLLDFGASANSQVPTSFVSGVTTPPTINRWNLQRIKDRTPNGSFVEFVYCGGEVSADGRTCTSSAWSGSKVLHYIRYTNRNDTLNGEFAVVFSYEARPDRIQTFHAGSAARQTQRLSKVRTYRGFAGADGSGALQLGTLVRSYDIAYEPHESGTTSVRATNSSRIQQIQETGADGQSLPPMTFAVAPDSVFGQVVTHRSSTTAGTPRPPAPCGGVVGGRRTLQCP